MPVRRFLFVSCAAVALSAGPGGAQSLRNPPVPAEFPPDSYTGTQYVDSAGCVFIRAGVGAVETWVPRLTRSRQPLCGFTPSLASARPDPAPAQQTQQTASAPEPRARARPQPAAAPRSASARPVPRAVEPATVIATPATASSVPPKPEAKPAARPTRRIAPPDPGRSACAGLSGVSAAYTVQHTGSPVRCGPQRAHYITYAQGGGTAAAPPPGTRATPDSVPPGTRVAPAHVYASQQTSLAGISVPEGMKPAWEDDRLNPHRAHQTFEGKARMDLMWTKTVPRRLIDRRTGAEVIHNFPGLQPPFTSFSEQRAAGVTVATRGSYVPDPVTTAGARDRRAAPRVSVSTRSAPADATAGTGQTRSSQPARQTAHYAQAGLFADAAQGLAAARRIKGAGLPARRGTLERNGRALTLVLAGPFGSEADAREGAARLRGMGFDNVRLR